MSNLLGIICYGILLWLGLYLLQRDIKMICFRFMGLSLISSSIGVALKILIVFIDLNANLTLIRIGDACWYVSIIMFSGALLFYQGDPSIKHMKWTKMWGYMLLPMFLMAIIYFVLRVNIDSYALYSKVLLTSCLIVFLINLVITIWKYKGFRTKALFFLPLVVYVMSIVKLVIQFDQNFHEVFMVNSVGLFFMVIVLYATIITEQGEVWLPDFIRSLDYTILLTLVFSGQVALVIVLSSIFNVTTVLLLLISMMISIFAQVFFRHIQTAFDHVAFMFFPKLRLERSRLSTTEKVKLVVNEEAHPELLDQEHLIRFTRRALSHIGDLQRLSSNPLTQLKVIDRRLQEKSSTQDVLDRANELKSILLECIEQLKPQQDQKFGITDEWRYYNSLYFPYVIGIKPYSKRYSNHQLSQEERDALEWFRTCVPERTFYNWTRMAARLVADHLKSQ